MPVTLLSKKTPQIATFLSHMLGRAVDETSLLHLIQDYQLLPGLIKALIIDKALVPFNCTSEEVSAYDEAFFIQKQLFSESERQAWLDREGLTKLDLSQHFKKKIRIEKFQNETFGKTINSYFLQRKPQLDYVIYSLIQHSDYDLLQELYFRLQEQEQSFAELAETYAQGTESLTKGIKGPVPFSQIPEPLAELIRTSQPGDIRLVSFNNCHCLLKLETIIPAVLDERMTQELLKERFDQWVETELSKIDFSSIQCPPVNECFD